MSRVYAITVEGGSGDTRIEVYRVTIPPQTSPAAFIRLYTEAWDDTVDKTMSLDEACRLRDGLAAAIEALIEELSSEQPS